jgi:hypothetical protein
MLVAERDFGWRRNCAAHLTGQENLLAMFSSERAPRCADATMPDVKTEDADPQGSPKSGH